MKKYSAVTIVLFVICLMAGMLVFSPGNALAKKQVVKLVRISQYVIKLVYVRHPVIAHIAISVGT